MQTLPALVMEWIVVIFIGLLGLIVLCKIWFNQISLVGLLNEPAAGTGASPLPATGQTVVTSTGPTGGTGGTVATGSTSNTTTTSSTSSTVAVGGGSKASMSRLQLLIFTFIIAGLYLTLCFEAGELIAIPNQVLGILGISGGSYVVSKGIQMSQNQNQTSGQ